MLVPKTSVTDHKQPVGDPLIVIVNAPAVEVETANQTSCLFKGEAPVLKLLIASLQITAPTMLLPVIEVVLGGKPEATV
jgi:hypothetical protein